MWTWIFTSVRWIYRSVIAAWCKTTISSAKLPNCLPKWLYYQLSHQQWMGSYGWHLCQQLVLSGFLFCFVCFSFCFRAAPTALEVPGLGMESEPQLYPVPQLWQCCILNPLSEAGNWNLVLSNTSWVCYYWPSWELSICLNLKFPSDRWCWTSFHLYIFYGDIFFHIFCFFSVGLFVFLLLLLGVFCVFCVQVLYQICVSTEFSPVSGLSFHSLIYLVQSKFLI